MISKKPRVFISYAHDGEALQGKVLELSETLRAWGVHTTVDLYVEEPPGGWRRWMNTEIGSADFVLVVCTALYRKRVEEAERSKGGLGSKWEGSIIFQGVYESGGFDQKVIPILFSKAHSKFIPVDIRHKNYYCIDSKEGFERFYRRITSQPEIVPGKVSEKLRVFEPIKSGKSNWTIQSTQRGAESGFQLDADGGRKSRTPRKSGKSSAPDSRRTRPRAGKAGMQAEAADHRPVFAPPIRDFSFEPGAMYQSVISLPLLRRLTEYRSMANGREQIVTLFDVVIELNRKFPGFPNEGKRSVKALVREAIGNVGNGKTSKGSPVEQGIDEAKSSLSTNYVFGRLSGDVLSAMVALDRQGHEGSRKHPISDSAIHRIWPDFRVSCYAMDGQDPMDSGVSPPLEVAGGGGVNWAVIDSGIDSDHPQFQLHANLEVAIPGAHQDFTEKRYASGNPLADEFGHGTGVAGIIAGEISGDRTDIRYSTPVRNEHGELRYLSGKVSAFSGIAPRCRLISLKVLDRDGFGTSSSIIVALEHINRLNDFGKKIVVHGATISVGYDFDPEWFASGLSPLCLEVDNLVRSGVIVVTPAGNTGYGPGSDLGTISDPGNAEAAITVGSTHGTLPEVYGVSYFSSKGPTSDGRRKPDMVAPGEKIMVCTAGRPKEELLGEMGVESHYWQASGTSLAAAHVSGVAAAFLSAKPHYQGKALEAKELFRNSCRDLGRVESHQGKGLISLSAALKLAET